MVTCSHIVGEHSTSSISFLLLTLLRFYLLGIVVIFSSFFRSIYLADVSLGLRDHVDIKSLSAERFSIFTQTSGPGVKGTCELDEGITLGENEQMKWANKA